MEHKEITGPPFCPRMGAIDVRLCQVELAAVSEVLCKFAKNALERVVFDPSLKATVARLVRRVAPRHVRPRRTGTEYPEHTIEHVTDFNVRAAALLRRSLQFLDGKAASDRLPLLITDVHLSLRSEARSAVDPLLENRFGTST